MKDQFGRHIDYLRISLTDRCNLRCVYCMPEEGIPSLCHGEILSLEEFSEVARIATKLGIKHVRLTGGEPLVRRGCVDLVRTISQIPGIESVALTTNATLLSSYAQELKDAGCSRINISLDTLDANQYEAITRRGNLQDALDGINAALHAGFETIKINAVAIKSLNQDWLDFVRLTLDKPLHVRFIEFMPMGHGTSINGSNWGYDDVIPTKELIQTISDLCEKEGLGTLVPAGNKPLGSGPAQYWKVPGAQGTIGFISSVSDHFCAECNRIRLTAEGKIRPCLFSDTELDIRTPLREGTPEMVEDVLKTALSIKPENHAHRIGTQRMMSQVGG